MSRARMAYETMQAALGADLDVLRRAGLHRSLKKIAARSGTRVECDGRWLLDFASNDYLGLASDSRIAGAARDALGGEGLGAAAARLVSGNHSLHTRLEEDLAKFKHAEAALLFSSGYAANIGAIPALVGRRDVIYADELNHASLIDACRLARAELRVVPHINVEAIREALRNDEGKFRRRLIVVDAVFSMDGDYYPLDQLVQLAREFDAWTYVDDAHGTGVLGSNGRGSAEYWGVEGEVDVLMGTLGKAIGVSGAFVAGSRVLVDFLVNRARSFIFTTGTPAALSAAVLASLGIVKEEPWRREKLKSNAARLRQGLANMGYRSGGAEDGHIIPVLLGESENAVRAGSALLEKGFLVGAIRPPTVPMGGARLRITASAAHEVADVNAMLEALREVLEPKSGAKSD